MANKTVTVDKTLSEVIASGLTDGANITINSGAIVTATVAPTVLIWQVTINEGKLLLDGANATEPIIFVWEESEEINVNGAGVLESTLGWWEFPTTSDGTASQTFDATTYFSNSLITADVFAGVWVETGRRITYSWATWITPVVWDWVFNANDKSVHWRIEWVGADYIIVTFLTGTLSNSDTIELHTVQDNKGSEYTKSWTATVVSDVLEPWVYQEFANVYQNSIDYLSSMGSGMAWFCFSQAYQSNTLTFWDGTNGFIPPNWAKIRVPMVHIATSTTTDIANNNSIWSSSTASKYELETINGWDCFLSGVSLGSAHFEDNLWTNFQAQYCAVNHAFGVYGASGTTFYKHCIFTPSIVADNRSSAKSLPAVVDLPNGSLVEDCLSIAMNDTSEVTNMGGQTSFGLEFNRNIAIGNGTTNEMEFNKVSGVIINDLVVIGTQLVSTTTTNADVKLLKTQAMIQGWVGWADAVFLTANSGNIKIVGWEILNDSAPSDSKVSIVDGSNIKVYGFHFIDDKFDNNATATAGQEFTQIAGLSADIEIARCYQTWWNPDEFAIIASGTSKNVNILNCSGTYTWEIQPTGINVSFRGSHWASGKIGSSTGFETDYPWTTGTNFWDVFRSDTTGMIYYRNAPASADYPISIVAGNPIFTRDWDVDVKTGDQWIVDMWYIALGHTGFTWVVTTTRNGSTANDGIDNWTGVDIAFQYDVGSWYNGTWLDLRIASNLTSITNTVDWVKLKLRFTANTNQTNWQSLTIHTTTTIQDQKDNYHPIEQFSATLSLTWLISWSDVVILEAWTNTVLSSIDQWWTTFNYTYSSLWDVDIWVIKPWYVTQYIYWYTLSNVNSSLPIIQVTDRNYA